MYDVRYLDLIVAAETIKLVQQLEHRPLHLPVPRLLAPEPLRADCVQLVDEDDRPALKNDKKETGRLARLVSIYTSNGKYGSKLMAHR